VVFWAFRLHLVVRPLLDETDPYFLASEKLGKLSSGLCQPRDGDVTFQFLPCADCPEGQLAATFIDLQGWIAHISGCQAKLDRPLIARARSCSSTPEMNVSSFRLFSLVFRLRIQTWLRIQTGGAGIAHFEAGTSGQKMTNFMLQNGCDDVTIL
jgi:hypothetical protein